MVVLVMDYAVFEVLRMILLMDFGGDEVRVRVSSWSCKLVVQVMLLFVLSLFLLMF